jgi:HKD family nuclease
MQTTYLLNTQELNMTFIKSLKSLLPNQDVEIRVSTVSKNNIQDKQWLKAISKNPSFDFLQDESEDIYSLNDGNPLDNEK